MPGQGGLPHPRGVFWWVKPLTGFLLGHMAGAKRRGKGKLPRLNFTFFSKFWVFWGKIARFANVKLFLERPSPCQTVLRSRLAGVGLWGASGGTSGGLLGLSPSVSPSYCLFNTHAGSAAPTGGLPGLALGSLCAPRHCPVPHTPLLRTT